MSGIIFIPAGGGGGGGERGPEGPAGPKGEFNFRGAWSNILEYAKGDATEEGGTTYASLKAGNTGHKPSELGEWWAVVAKKGADGAVGERGPEGKEGPKGTNGIGFKLSVAQEPSKERVVAAEIGPLSAEKDALVTAWYASSSTAASSIAATVNFEAVASAGFKAAAIGNTGPSITFFVPAGKTFTINGTNAEKLRTTHWFVN